MWINKTSSFHLSKMKTCYWEHHGFDRLGASMKFLERQISFTLKDKKMELNVNALGHTIPIVNTLSFYKSIKSSISSYMIFVKECDLDNKSSNVSNEESNQVRFLNEYQDIFIEDMPNELPSSRGEDDHSIDIVPGSLLGSTRGDKKTSPRTCREGDGKAKFISLLFSSAISAQKGWLIPHVCGL